MISKKRVMVIDDSILFRNWLINNINSNQRFEVVGYAINAFDAKQKIPALKPDIITLDIVMPGMSGIDFLKEFLPVHPIPAILVSSLNLRVFDALAAGAVDFVRKPDMESGQSKDLFLSTLLSKLSIASCARVRLPRTAEPAVTTARAGTAHQIHPAGHSPFPSHGTVSPAPAGPLAGSKDTRELSFSKLTFDNDRLIAIGASTGGTEAILEVLTHLPAKIPGIVITQHMPPGFTSMYAERLNRLCKFEVREAQSGDRVQPGLALIAPGGLQMKLVRMGNGYAVNCVHEDKVNGHCPSVDVLFDSVASIARDKAIGVLLTGMGADGAAGLLRMRKNGAYTIGQDKESCIVYGMPMEAFNIGAVCKQLPLTSIAQNLLSKLAEV